MLINLLDWKDKKVLRELDKNARQPYSEIARKTRISKQIVIYRLNNMVERGIVKSFITFIDVKSLGYTFYDAFFKLKYCSQEEEAEIIQSISQMPEIGWFISTRGEWNLVICMLAKSPEELNETLDKIMKILGNKVIESNFFIVIEASQMPYREALDDFTPNMKSIYIGNPQKIVLKKFDVKILKYLSDNCRFSIVDLAGKMRSTIEKVRYSIKKMENVGIIQAYKPLLDHTKIGYIWDIMLIQYSNCSKQKKEEFIKFLKDLKQVFYLVKGVGNWNLMIEFHTKEPQELDNIRTTISTKFKSIIRGEKIIQITKEHKCIFLPNITV